MICTEPLCVGRPNMPPPELIDRYMRVPLSTAWLTNDGPLVRELEGRIQAWCKERGQAVHAVAVCNATVGLQIALTAWGVNSRSIVAVPAYTFPATVQAIEWIRAKPYLLDLEHDGYWVTAMGAFTATLPVAAYGITGSIQAWAATNLEWWRQVADAAHAPMILDAAGSWGNCVNGRPVITFGDCAVLSLHATKVVFGGEGGVIVTANAEKAAAMRRLRNFGFGGKIADKSYGLGTNGKLSELHAALALASLDYYPTVQKQNRAIWEMYKAYLLDTGILSYPSPLDNHHYVVTSIPDGRRDAVMEALRVEGCRARRYYWPGCHAEEDAILFPETVRIAERVLVLPTGFQMDETKVRAVCGIIKQTMEVRGNA
jgi:dTDP-4-amino-4,6-dideoxygalactose transaminase